MDVSSQPDIVSKIPPVVIGILVNHDAVGTPDPVIAITNVIRSDGKIEPAEPETAWASAFDAKRVPLAEAAGKMSVLPGMIEVVVRIVLARIMPDPFVAAGMDVGSFGVALLVAKGTSLFGSAF